MRLPGYKAPKSISRCRVPKIKMGRSAKIKPIRMPKGGISRISTKGFKF